MIGGYTVMELPAKITGRENIFGYDVKSIIQASRALECELMVRHAPAARMQDTFASHLSFWALWIRPSNSGPSSWTIGSSKP